MRIANLPKSLVNMPIVFVMFPSLIFQSSNITFGEFHLYIHKYVFSRRYWPP